jgi:transglutaminase-like putative cysteine protease
VIFFIFVVYPFGDISGLWLKFVSNVSDVPNIVVTDDLLREGGEYWEIITDDAKQIGFQRTIIRNKYFERQSRLIALRQGERFDIATTLVSESDVDGFFASGKTELKAGLEPVETNFRVEDDKLIISTNKTNDSIAWNKLPGANAVIISLLQKPMQRAEKRKIKYFDPSQAKIIETILNAAEEFNSGEKLLEIKAASYIDDKIVMDSVYKTDRNGNIIYTETKFGDKIIRTARTSKQHATAIITRNTLIEYGNVGEVILSVPVKLPQKTSPLSFLVKIKNSAINNSILITDWFVNTPFQKVEIADSESAIITVWSSIDDDPTKYGNKSYENIAINVTNNIANNATQLNEYLASGKLIDLDDPNLDKLAALVDSDKLNDWQTAIALEKLVSKRIRLDSFMFGFASSSDVLRYWRGDCTEFAVLLAALCRKKGIPARIVVGLVYSNPKNKNISQSQNQNKDQNQDQTQDQTNESQYGKMVFHLWNEAYIDGIWRPLDAMYGLGGADAARIKLADDSLKNDSIAAICRSIFITIGQIEIIPQQ